MSYTKTFYKLSVLLSEFIVNKYIAYKTVCYAVLIFVFLLISFYYCESSLS